jgi:transcriptional regulator
MHPAAAFRTTDAAELVRELRARPFLTLAAAPRGAPLLAHAPVVVRDTPDGLALDFHLSRGNPLADHLAAGFRAVAAGLGPEGYVSPDWYAASDQVPTWNYILVEAEGPVAPLAEADLVALLDDLTAQEEGRLAPKRAWTRGKMAPGRFEAMVRAVVGARLRVERLEGVFKLSQNKSEADRAGVIAALGAHPLAKRMGQAGPG